MGNGSFSSHTQFSHLIPKPLPTSVQTQNAHLTDQALVWNPFVGRHDTQPSHLLDHVVGVGSGAARAVAAQRAVDVGGEVVREVGDLKAALQAGLPAQDAPEKRGKWPSVGKASAATATISTHV